MSKSEPATTDITEARINAAARWLQSDDSAYTLDEDAARRAARLMLDAADAVASAYHRIIVLEGMLRDVRDALLESYMQIPSDQYPGPPTSIIANINRVIGEPDVNS